VPPPRLPSKEEVKAKADAWVDCAWKKAAELDDGRSDAATIAEPVRIACRHHYLFTDNDDKGFAINVVLTQRSSAKNKPSDAQIKAASEKWADCVIGGALQEDDGVSAPAVIAERIRTVCHKLYNGTSSEEQSLVIMAVQKVRARGAQDRQVIVSPPQRTAPGELRF
jgi:hypothetical protein